MNIRNGTRRHRVDRRDHSFHRTFPQFAGTADAVLQPLTYSYDAGLTMPNQNVAEPPLTDKPYSFGCTGFATTDTAGNEDKTVYLPGYTYEQTCLIEGHGDDKGCDMRNSMKSITVYGLKKESDTDAQAVQQKRGKYFIIDKAPGRDWFDSHRIALRANAARRTGISVGTMWFGEWTSGQVGPDGILTGNFAYDGNPNDYAWHDWVISGETVINGISYLVIKSWQGKNIGAGGWLYMDRETFNKVYDVFGTISLMPGMPVGPEDIQYVKLTLTQTVIDLINRLIGILRLQIPNYA